MAMIYTTKRRQGQAAATQHCLQRLSVGSDAAAPMWRVWPDSERCSRRTRPCHQLRRPQTVFQQLMGWNSPALGGTGRIGTGRDGMRRDGTGQDSLTYNRHIIVFYRLMAGLFCSVCSRVLCCWASRPGPVGRDSTRFVRGVSNEGVLTYFKSRSMSQNGNQQEAKVEKTPAKVEGTIRKK